jgi:hypothetical protein
LSEAATAQLWKKLAWFLGLWAAGVATIAAVSFALHWWLL